jgi:hypothetical protein
MDIRAVARAHLLITALLALAAAALAAFGGLLLGGPAMAALSGVVTGAGACAGSFLVRRRVFADLRKAEGQASAEGFAEGLSQGVLLGVATYQAAAFPLAGPGSVTVEERAARRTLAYRIAADDGLPHTLRTAAAAALEAIDDGLDDGRARDAVRRLALAVYEQRRPR